MSVEITSMPPWKQALLEKKRRQEIEERKRREEEEARLARMPPWKRDIILKKQNQKNSIVFIGKTGGKADLSRDSLHEDFEDSTMLHEESLIDGGNLNNNTDFLTDHVQADYECDDTESPSLTAAVNSTEPGVEHLVPIKQNPWVRTDPSFHIKPRGRRLERSSKSSKTPLNNHPGHGVTDGLDTNERLNIGNSDDVFGGDRDGDEEFSYGRGFVHKLLRKFSHLSERESTRMEVSPKRSHSTEDILDDFHKISPRGLSSSGSSTLPRHIGRSRSTERVPATYSTKAFSMENLTNHSSVGVKPVHKSQSLHETLEPHEETVTNEYKAGSVDTLILDVEESTTEKDISGDEVDSSENSPRLNSVSATRSLFEKSSHPTADIPKSRSVEGLPKYAKNQNNKLGASTSNSASLLEHSSNLEHGSQSSAHVLNGSLSSSDQSSPPTSPEKNLQGSQEVLKNIRTAGKVWYSSDGEASQQSIHSSDVSSRLNEMHSANNLDDMNANLTSNQITADNKTISNHDAEKNFKNIMGSSTKSEPIAPPRSPSKKRRAPPAPSAMPSITQASDSPSSSSSVNSTSVRLDMDVTTSSTDDNTTGSYRDLYFSKSKSSSSAASGSTQVTSPIREPKPLVSHDRPPRAAKPAETVSAQPLRGSAQPLRGESSTSAQPLRGSAQPLRGESSTSAQPLRGSAQPLRGESSTSSVTSTSRVDDGASAEITRRTVADVAPKVERPNSIISNTSKVTLEDLKRNNFKQVDRTETKRAAKIPAAGKSTAKTSSPPNGPGLLLIRPASNLVPATSAPPVQYTLINKYNDVKTGTFEPAKKRPAMYGAYDDDYDDIPVTNIDDVLGDVPTTNIDDVNISPKAPLRNNEVDADLHRRQVSKRFEFAGAGVKCGRSLLAKTKPYGKLKISFDETATSTYEYPSEASLLELMPPEPGDIDYPHPHKPNLDPDSPTDEDVDLTQLNTSLKSNPAMANTAGLASYKSKSVAEYHLGMDNRADTHVPPVVRRDKRSMQDDDDEMQIKPAEEHDTSSWSNSNTSDMLF